MSFLVPLLLGALAALAVPIALHLRQRDRREPFRFPSLMFLARLPIETERRRRLTDWPLLLLRALALAFLVLAFARPVRDVSAADEEGRPRAVVLLLDRSQSMRAADTWRAARDSMLAVVAALGPDDRVALVAADERPEVLEPLTGDHDAVRRAITRVEAGDRGTRLAPAARVALELLRDAGGTEAELVVVSDLQAGLLAGLDEVRRPVGVTVRTMAVPSADANVAVVDARVVASAPTDGDDRPRVDVVARVQRFGEVALPAVRARLVVDGREVGEVPVPLGDGATDVEVADVRFAGVPRPAADAPATIVLAVAGDGASATATPDPRPADDTLDLVIPADDDVALLVAGADADAVARTPFVRALEVADRPRLRVQTRGRAILDDAGRLGATLEAQRVLVLDDVAVRDEAARDALRRWRAAGGGVVLLADATVARDDATAATLAALGLAGVSFDGVADRGGAGGGTIASWDAVHPLFAAFDGAPAGLRDARLLRYPRATVIGGRVLARFDDGLPAVVASADSGAPALLVLAPLSRAGGELPLAPAFAPFVRALVHVAGTIEPRPVWWATGDDAPLPPLEAPVLVAPDGDVRRLDAGAPRAVLEQRGPYALFDGRVSGEPVRRFAADAPADEAALPALTPDEITDAFAVDSADLRFGRAPLTAIERERRDAWWRWLVAAALAFLAAETILGSTGRRARAALRRPTDLFAGASR